MSSMPNTPRKLSGQAQVFAIVRRKGGVGTTTSTIAMATGLAMRGYKVIILEGDDNRRLSRTLLGLDRKGTPPIDDSQTTYHMFTHPEEGVGNSAFYLDLAALVPEIPGDRNALLARRGWTRPAPLRIIPGTRALRRLETKFLMATQSTHTAQFEPHMQFSRAIETIKREYDFIFIDTPSMLSLITLNEVMAAQHALFVLDFDPDSRYDLDEAVDFYRTVRANCASLGIPAPNPLGVIYNKFTGSEDDQALYTEYTQPHFDDDAQDVVPALVPYRELGLFPMDDRTMKSAMRRRRPVHITAPESALGTSMFTLCSMIEQLIGASAPVGVR